MLKGLGDQLLKCFQNISLFDIVSIYHAYAKIVLAIFYVVNNILFTIKVLFTSYLTHIIFEAGSKIPCPKWECM